MQAIAKLSPAYKMYSSTIRIEIPSTKGGSPTWGTGFLYDRAGGGAPDDLFVITNRHVACDRNGVVRDRLGLHYALDHEGRRDTKKRFVGVGRLALLHDDPLVDLAAIPLEGLVESLVSGNTLDHHAITPDELAGEGADSAIEPFTRVVMVGYPQGSMDLNHHLPIARAGVVATPYQVDYHDSETVAGHSVFALDIAGFKGSSGSPVFLDSAGDGITLVGINSQNRSEMLTTRIATHEGEYCFAEHPIHMAMCVKARRILDLWS